MTYRHVESEGSRIAIVTDEKGPNPGDNYTVLLWDNGTALMTHSFHIANATAIANDWVYNAHDGVYVNIVRS